MIDLASVLAEARVLPIVRTDTPDEAARIVAALVGAGAPAVELTATIPGWGDLLRRTVAAYPGTVIGMGTVTDPVQAREAVAAGAAFLVSPWLAAGARAAAWGTPFIEGGLTPTELAAAARGGVVKLFPAHHAGPAYLKSVLAVLPGAAVIPTGGISPDEVPAWLDAGAIAVGVGSEVCRAADPAAVFAATRARALAA